MGVNIFPFLCIYYGTSHTNKDTVFDFSKLISTPCWQKWKASQIENLTSCIFPLFQPQVMDRLIEFAYTASISVGEKCVIHVMNGAVMYQIDSVVKACCDFLVQQLDPSNAIGIASFAEQIGCTELHQKAREYIYMNFSQVWPRKGGTCSFCLLAYVWVLPLLHTCVMGMRWVIIFHNRVYLKSEHTLLEKMGVNFRIRIVKVVCLGRENESVELLRIYEMLH